MRQNSDPQISIKMFLNIYDVTKILISDWTAAEFTLYSLNCVFARYKLHYSSVYVTVVNYFKDKIIVKQFAEVCD